MKKRLLRLKSMLLLPMLFLLLMAMSIGGMAQTLIPDQTDYAPGTLATITVDGFTVGEAVYIHVDHFIEGYGHEDEDYTLDAVDNIQSPFFFYYNVGLDEALDEFIVTARQTNGKVASCSFTDAPKASFSSASIDGTSAICSGQSSTLGLSISTCGSGAIGYTISSYLWQKSTNNSTWSNADGTNSNDTYDASPTSDTYYHCIITLSKKQDNCDNVTVVYTTSSFKVTVNALPNNTTDGFSGNTICLGETGTLTFDALNTGFTGPYTIIYGNGTNQWSQTINTADATTFNVAINPTSTTNYTLVKITNANGCERTSGFGKSGARITVYQLPTVSCPTTFSASSCSFSNQTDVDAAYATWLATASATNGTLTNNNNGAPAICGGTKTVTFTSTSYSGCGTTSCDASFIITPAKAVAVTGPTTIDATSCTYATQSDVDAAFKTWIET
ncbi:MAG: hypothetical protein PHP53_15025, partial [Prolixibacteraceae bacterium]|nr:hypothetical protein [Prolixibacteraceae bacterium]